MRLLFLTKEFLRYPKTFLAFDTEKRLDSVAREDVDTLVKAKLETLLRAAVQDVPYYRELALQGRIDAANPKLEQFPVLEKKDIRGREEMFVSDRYRRSKLSACRTSGSTGEPFRFYREPKEFDATYVDLWRGLARLGIRRGDRRVLVKGVDEVPNLSWRVRLRRWMYGVANQCIVVDAHFLARSEDNVRAALHRILRYRPHYLHGYVSSIDLLAEHAERWGMDMTGLKLKAVVTESEKLYDFQRERIGRVFGCPVAENYGSVEFGMIAQPDAKGNLCINEDHCLVEAGPEGEAILTNLDAYAFPFIRFKNGDAITLRQEKRSALPYHEIERVDGRIADTIHLPGGGYLQGFIVMYPISKHMDYIGAYQIRQCALDALDIYLVEKRKLPDSVMHQIKQEMQEIVGPKVRLELRMVEGIPLTARGKRRFVVSELPK